jgi:proline dehydrogenase
MLIQATRSYAERNGLRRDQFEFQMLYGVRRDAQEALVREGYRMRVYVPFGTEWYAYFTRRVAERPGNALFVVRQMLDGRQWTGRP